MLALLLTVLLARDASVDSGSQVSVRAFRTEAAPRVQSVFGDPITLRASIDMH